MRFPCWSALCEVSESPRKPVDANSIVADIERMFREQFLPEGQQIVSTWHRRLNYGYPVPCLERDHFLTQLDATLRRLDIRSRGRFGGWKYESSNQDNSFMQGVEAVDNLLFGAEELSYFYPDLLSEGAVDRRLP